MPLGVRKEGCGATGTEPGLDLPVGGGDGDGAGAGARAVGAVGAGKASGGPRLP